MEWGLGTEPSVTFTFRGLARQTKEGGSYKRSRKNDQRTWGAKCGWRPPKPKEGRVINTFKYCREVKSLVFRIIH